MFNVNHFLMHQINDKYVVLIFKGKFMDDTKNKITFSYTRPSTTVDWGPNIKSPELIEHYQNNYINTGMIVSENVQISEDGLTLTRINIWSNETPELTGFEIILHYKSDTVVQTWIAERNAYNELNGITSSVPYTEFLAHEDNLMFTGEVSGPWERV
jgi:hypothetical protein